MRKTDPEKLRGHIDSFRGRKILVLGDLLLDEYIWGNAERISPEAPVPVVNISKREFRPGGAANVAMTISALGGNPLLCGVVGSDDSGQKFIETLKSPGISTEGVRISENRITPLKTRVIASNQQMLRIDHEDVKNIDKHDSDKLVEYLIEQLDYASALLISDYAKGLINGAILSPVLDHAKSLGLVITVDPKPVNINFYKGVTLISPNLKEAHAASGVKITDRESLRKAAEILMNKISPKALLVTRGGEGLSLFTSDGGENHLPAITSHVYDVSGAGDTLVGTLTLAMASGADMMESIELANYAAGVVVRKPGVAAVSTDELKMALDTQLNWE